MIAAPDPSADTHGGRCCEGTLKRLLLLTCENVPSEGEDVAVRWIDRGEGLRTSGGRMEGREPEAKLNMAET